VDLSGLDQRQGFEALVHGSEAARQNYEPVGIFEQKNFAHKEVFHSDVTIEIRIGLLLPRQFDVAADGPATDLLGSPVCGFHQTGAAAGHDRKAKMREARSHVARKLVVRMRFLETGTAKDRHARADKMQRPKSTYEFCKNPNDEAQLTSACVGSFEEVFVGGLLYHDCPFFPKACIGPVKARISRFNQALNEPIPVLMFMQYVPDQCALDT